MNKTFVTMGRYQYSSEAQIIKGRLESDGIQVFLKDNITIDTDPLVSNAIGGIKLKVHFKDEKKAKEILRSIKAYALDDNGNPITCPNCKGHEVELYSTIDSTKAFLSFLIGLLTFTLPFHARYKYICENCKTKFPVK